MPSDFAPIESLPEQLAALGSSELFRYLPALSEGNISAYLQKMLSCEKDTDLSKVVTLEDFVTYFGKGLPEQFLLLCSHLSCDPDEKADTFINQARFIMQTVEECHPDKVHLSLEDFLSLSDRKKQQEVFTTYLSLENKLLTMITLIQLWHAKDIPQVHSILLNPILNRWLNGQDLVWIDICFPLCIQEMIELSVEWRQFDDQEKEDNKHIHTEVMRMDSLLRRIKAADWLLYLSPKYDFLTRWNHVAALKKALRCNHPDILHELNEEVLTLMVKGRYGSDLPTLILQSSIAFHHLGNESLLECCQNLTLDDFKIIFRVNPHFIERFNFELAFEILQKKRYLAEYFILNHTFLEKISSDQIPMIAAYLSLEAIEKTLLVLIENIVVKMETTARIHFLVSLAKANNHFPFAIAINNQSADMLDLEAINIISSLCPRAAEALAERANRLRNSAISIPTKSSHVEPIQIIISKPNDIIDQPPKRTTTLNWKKALKIGGLVLLGLIGVGLIATGGFGAVIGIPLLFQVICIFAGGTCLISAAGGWAHHFLSQKKATAAIKEYDDHQIRKGFSSQAKINRRINKSSNDCTIKTIEQSSISPDSFDSEASSHSLSNYRRQQAALISAVQVKDQDTSINTFSACV